jgi:hypothetical protein
MAYDNNNSGMLARSDRKTLPTHPDYSGQCEIDGKQYWLSAWIKEGKAGGKLAGKKFFSLSFKPKEAQQASQATPADADAMESTSAPATAGPVEEDVGYN